MIRAAVIASVTWWMALVAAASAWAQRVEFPAPYPSTPPLAPVNPAPLPAPPSFGQGAYLGGSIQPFDPYALPGNVGTFGAQPGAYGFGAPYAGPPGWPGPAPTPLPGGGTPYPPSTLPPGLPSLGAPYGNPVPGAASGLQPVPMNPYPNYNGSPYATNAPSGVNTGSAATGSPYTRLFQDTGLRATYLYGGGSDDDLALTEVEASTTVYFANLFRGLRVTPGFVFYWTQGPSHSIQSDVPARLYDAYLDFGLQPRWNERMGAELNARLGVYSDFQTFGEDSLRILATGAGVYQVTPQTSLKLGVSYIDRVDLKLLPAFGILWTPNSQTRWDLFFPSPKLANYWTTVGNQQVWWYVSGEYGGGSWHIERADQPPDDDRMDINDVRINLGVEWFNINRMYGFFDVGYAFNRELVYYRVPSESAGLDNTFMLRGGISW